MTARPWFRGWTLTLVVAASGCSAATGSGTNPFAPPGENQGPAVQVVAQNQEDQDVRVYAVIKGVKHEIGVASPYTTTMFTMAAPSTGSMRIRVEPEEGLEHTTGDVLVRAGDTLNLYITPDPANTYVETQ